MRRQFFQFALVCMFNLSVHAYASSEPVEQDPFESINRITFTFNDYLDRFLLKPVAKGYRKIAPGFVEEGVLNFFDNLGEPLNIVNALLQGKLENAGSDSLRLLVNSTVGLFGFIDIGSRIGLEKHDEDFGQTLGKWGISSGPYVVLPLLGPSTIRDAIATVPDSYMSPTQGVDHQQTRYELYATELISKRADLFDKEDLMAGDRYSFIRDAYLQNRKFKVTDGQSDEDAFEDDFDDDLLFDEDEE